MAYPRMRRVGVKEHHSVDASLEKIIDVEWLPPDSHLLYQSYDIVIMTEDEDIELDHYQMLDLHCWFFPLFDADEAQMPRWQDIPALYNKRVPKVDSVIPVTAWGQGQTAEDQTLGDVDTELFFRPDRISLMTLEDLNAPQVLYGRRINLGYPYGSGLRTADNSCKWMTRMRGFCRMGVPTRRPGVIVWTLTNPPSIADNVFEPENLIPADRQWTSLDFLTPGDWRSKVFNQTTYSTEDDWRKWSLHYMVDNNANDEVLFDPQELHVIIARDAVFRLTDRSASEVSPTPVAA